MRAIILAAGEGSRLRPHTLDRPKCLVELAGRSLLSYQLGALHAAGVEDIVVVAGYRADQLRESGFKIRRNSGYATTNMVTSLMCAEESLDGGDDVVIVYADLIFESRILEALLRCPAPLSTTVDRQWRSLWELRLADPLEDAETLRLNEQGLIMELGRRPQSLAEIEGQYMGLTKISAAMAPQIVTHYRNLDPGRLYDGKDLPNMYMTSFLQHLIDDGFPLTAVLVDSGWLEVDTAADLALYHQLHATGELARFCAVTEIQAQRQS